MNRDDAKELWMPARSVFKEITKISEEDYSVPYKRSQALAELLSIPYPESGHYQALELTDEHKRTLKLLAGPGGWIVRKILEARKRDT